MEVQRRSPIPTMFTLQPVIAPSMAPSAALSATRVPPPRLSKRLLKSKKLKQSQSATSKTMVFVAIFRPKSMPWAVTCQVMPNHLLRAETNSKLSPTFQKAKAQWLLSASQTTSKPWPNSINWSYKAARAPLISHSSRSQSTQTKSARKPPVTLASPTPMLHWTHIGTTRSSPST